MKVKKILLQQSQDDLSNEDTLIAIHLFHGHSHKIIAECMGISVVRVSHRVAFLKQESLLEKPAPITNSSKLESVITNTLKATAPKTKRKAVNTKRATANKSKSPLEVDVNDWSPTHLLKYFEIRWCEQSWKTPPPRWQAKDRMNAKRVLETYSDNVKTLIDYLFDHWSSLQTQFKITGLPNISILWGFRNSIAPLAFGDVSSQSTSKSWGSSHDSSQERDDGDELGW